MTRKIVTVAFVGLCSFLLAGCASSSGDDTKSVSRASLGDSWPLTLDSGEIACKGQAVTFKAPDGAIYAVNGIAMSRTDLRDIHEIWADDPDFPGSKINIGPLIDAGLKLCDK